MELMSVSVATTVMQSMRLPFLLLTPSVLLLAFALAEYTGSSLYWLDMALIMVAGISAHMSVNLLNEHSDFRTGLDMQTERTPFSGGSGGLPANPEAASVVYKAGIATLVLTVGIGFYYVLIFGYQLLLLGTLGALLIVAYTPIINRSAWACLIAPGLAFGPLMVLGSWYILVGYFDWTPVLVSLIPFFMINNLLLLNQFPDVAADEQAGRKHFVICYGYEFSAYMYGLQAMAAVLVLLGCIINQLLPPTAFVALLPVGLQLVVAYGAWKHQANIARLMPFMAMNVIANLLTPALLAVLMFVH